MFGMISGFGRRLATYQFEAKGLKLNGFVGGAGVRESFHFLKQGLQICQNNSSVSACYALFEVVKVRG